MFDTMTLTKAVAGVCGALLVFLFGNWAAETLYHGGGAHGDEHAQAYVIEVEGADHGGEEAAVEEGPDFAEVFASADAAAGEGLWRNCRSCHALEEGQNGTGPSLYGVVGRPIDAIDGFAYSGALLEVGETWTPENLNTFLADPKGAAPGTKMSFRGLPKIEDRANLIAYLSTIGG
ncbi:cytochrome c family protein [Loktanella sp. IMCC34160]|uniref:c-type cytochrome n=1 Tax=Loktanella sp. IMCC34160 TaxID=2510646 RepID=UPI00101C3E84|nr:cytochrome c family protein [Loktanella sp. IMCC34160]RYG91567.1 cytochrome c family protein [Loktanella sp. IMCC34160]